MMVSSNSSLSSVLVGLRNGTTGLLVTQEHCGLPCLFENVSPEACCEARTKGFHRQKFGVYTVNR